MYRVTFYPVMTLNPEQLEALRQAETDGNRVALAIQLSGLSKAEVSRSAGIPYTYVVDVAAGRFETITVQNAHKFAAFFGCAIEDLFPLKVA